MALLPRPLGGWLLALLVSLLLHGLLLLTFAGLPGGSAGSLFAPPGPPPDPALGEAPAEPEPLVFLAPRRTPPRRAPNLVEASSPAPIEIASPPGPSPSDLGPPLPTLPAPANPVPETAGPTQGPPSIPGGGTGSGTSTTFFQIPARAERVVYVIDRSGSMGMDGALNAARRELLASLERLPATAFFQIIVYNSNAAPLVPSLPGWLPATPENRTLIALALRNLQPEGGTAHDRALPLALSLQPDVIFFLTDADDLTEQQVRTLSRYNHGRSVIHAVELSTANRGHPEKPLQVLARENRGLYQAIDLDAYR